MIKSLKISLPALLHRTQGVNHPNKMGFFHVRYSSLIFKNINFAVLNGERTVFCLSGMEQVGEREREREDFLTVL
jgi:hypothetical protein